MCLRTQKRECQKNKFESYDSNIKSRFGRRIIPSNKSDFIYFSDTDLIAPVFAYYTDPTIDMSWSSSNPVPYGTGVTSPSSTSAGPTGVGGPTPATASSQGRSASSTQVAIGASSSRGAGAQGAPTQVCGPPFLSTFTSSTYSTSTLPTAIAGGGGIGAQAYAMPYALGEQVPKDWLQVSRRASARPPGLYAFKVGTLSAEDRALLSKPESEAFVSDRFRKMSFEAVRELLAT